ncbi:MAG TPA: condensation domain-containing protein, partial [Xanthomonadales bacterium]|nr:condensation domain-containing protein [Xanthomonadales bacterium]
VAPLTESQQEIWLTCQFGDAANCSFNESLTLHLDGELDAALFTEAVERVVARHDAFRLRFAPDGATQRLSHDAALRVVTLDFAGHDADSAYHACCATEAARPFDLERGPLVRATLVRLAPNRHALYFVAHHLVFDGWGASVLVEEMLTAYRQLREGAPVVLPPAPSYLDYARRQAEPAARAATAEDLAWWLEQLEGVPAALELPTDRPRPAQMEFAGAAIRQALDAPLWARVREAAARHKASPYAFLLAIHFALLARLTGQRDLVVAFPQAGQARGPWQDLVGDCVSFLPLRIRLDPAMPFAVLLDSVRSALLDAAEHGRCTFGELARAANFARVSGRMPLAQTVLTLNPRYVLPSIPGLVARVSENPKRHVRWDLLLVANESGDALELDAQYNAAVFEAGTIRRWMGMFRAMLDRATHDTARSVDALGADEASLAANPDAPAVPLDDGHTLLSLFLERARAEPGREAIAARGVRLGYGEVERESERIAAMLVEAGVARGDIVAIAMPRRAEILAAALGAWRAGAAYVPLDPTHPGDRLDYMAKTAGVGVVLSLRSARLPQRLLDGRLRIDVDARRNAAGDASEDAIAGLPPPPQPHDLAYVLFTSGSTGRPKGARILHRGVANVLRSALHEPGLRADDAVVARATFAFDFAVLELFAPLLAGARVVLADEAEQRDPYALSRLVERERASVLCGTPSQLRAQLASRWPRTDAPLRIVLGGEPVDRALADALLSKTDEAWNIYGPTETTIYSTIERLADDGAPISVGRPIANTRVYVVGEDGRALPHGG